MNITCEIKLSGGVGEVVTAHSVSDCAAPVL